MKVQTNIIELQEISFVYSGEKIPVWQGLNCCFKQQTINLILGPSGCGKSTLLYLLNGIIPHAIEGSIAGKILLNGENIVGKEPKEMAQHMGMVFQDPDSQFCTFLVEDELAFGLENMCKSEKEMDIQIQMALEMVGMTSFRKSLLEELSGGQKQKIAIATALAMESDILIMDEPTANLDAKSRVEIFKLLERLIQEYKKTIIIVEHNLDGLIEKAGHIIVFDEHSNNCLSGTSSEVISKLIFDKTYQKINVFLPEYLLILRKWACANYKVRSVQKYCEKQLEYHRKMTDAMFELDVVALSELIQRFPIISQIEEPPCIKKVNTVVEAQNLQFSYETKRKKKCDFFMDGKNATLKNVSFKVHEGEFVAIVGANGAGKSTLLNIIFRVLENYSGNVVAMNSNLRNIKKQQLYNEFGLVFQNPEWQFVTNDVNSELLFSLKNVEMLETEKQIRVDEVLERFHLLDEKQKSPFILSQGQKRRLSVATMLLTKQKVLFLDEPTYGQDYENQVELMNLLVELNQAGITVIMVTHNMSLVAEYANSVILLLDGVVEFQGTPKALFKQEELVKKGCLELPGSYVFSKQLQEYFNEIPEFYNSRDFTQYLNAITKKGGD